MSRFDVVRLDVRYAVRRFRREKTVAILAVVTLAAGIGASSAIFSVTDRVLLRPLPYPGAEEIVLFGHAPAVYSQAGAAVQADVAALSQFAAIGLYAEGGANVTVQQLPQRIRAAAATSGLFAALGVAPLQGRVFDATETRESKVAVIAWRLWQRAFDRDPAVLGRTLRLNSQSFVVIGVMPPGFDFPNGTEVWTPPLADRQISEGGLRAIARLAPGVSVTRATEALRSAYRRIYGERYDVVAPLSPLRAELVEGTRPTLLFLSALVGLLLAEACVSLAGLLLARLRGRERELIVRRALGAGRGRLVGQIVTEALLTTVVGGVAGSLVALVALRLLGASGLGLDVVRDVTRVDIRFFVVVALVSALSGLLFSMGPALWVSG